MTALGPRPEGEREPLWAGPRADEVPRPPEPVEPAPPVAEPDEPPRPAPRSPANLLGWLAALAAVAFTVVLIGRSSSFTLADVPSSWEDIEMTCRTARFEEPNHSFELFRCRAIDGGELPPGRYRSPEAQWTSDITRVDARASLIRITRDGVLDGWAIYR